MEDLVIWFALAVLASGLVDAFAATLTVASRTSLHPGKADFACDGIDDQIEIQQALDALPERERTLIWSIYFKGMSIKQAGEQIGISKAWASRLHSRILHTLAAQISGPQEVSVAEKSEENITDEEPLAAMLEFREFGRTGMTES